MAGMDYSALMVTLQLNDLLSAQLSKTDAALGKTEASVKKTATTVQSLGQSFGQVTGNLAQMSGSVSVLSQSLSGGAGAVTQFFAGVSGLSRGVMGLNSGIASGVTALGQFGIAGSAASTGVGALVGGVIAIVGVFTALRAATELASSGFGAFVGVVEQVGNALLDFKDNAQFEQFEVTLAVLNRSWDKSREKMKEFIDFAVRTPFRMEQVQQAGITLQNFGFMAEDTQKRFGMSSQDIMETAGDVAAGVQAMNVSFSEVAMYLGRLTTASSFGMAIARFEELGVVSRRELTAMGIAFDSQGTLVDKSAKGLDKALSAVLEIMKGKYGGLMELQSMTFNGLVSNIQDWASITMQTVRQPLFDAVEGQLGKFYTTVLKSPEVNAAIERLTEAVAKLAPYASALAGFFTEIAAKAISWGTNITGSLADGLVAGARMVYQALMSLGGFIEYWLKPGSPPKLLPKLTVWGTGAANAYLEGWGKADFSTLTELGDVIEATLRNMVSMGDLPEKQLIPLLMGSQEDIAEAIEMVRTMGSVTEEAFQKIREAAGPAADIIDEYVSRYFEAEKASERVAKAQDELTQATQRAEEAQRDYNKTVEESDAALKPYADALEQIKQKREDLNMLIREKEIDEQLKNNSTNKKKKTAAEEQLEGINDQIDAIESKNREKELQKKLRSRRLRGDDRTLTELELQKVRTERTVSTEQKTEEEKEKKLTVEKRRLLELEKQELASQRAYNAAKKERDETVKAAKDREKAAKEEEDTKQNALKIAQDEEKAAKEKLATEKAIIDLYQKQAQLVAEQRRIEEKKGKKGTDTGGGAGNPWSGTALDPDSPNSIQKKTEELGQHLENMKEKIRNSTLWQVLRSVGTDMKEVFGRLTDEIKAGDWEGAINVISTGLQNGIVKYGVPLATKIQTEWVPALTNWLKNDVWPTASKLLGDWKDNTLTWLGEKKDDLAQKLRDEWVPAFTNWAKDNLWPILKPLLDGVLALIIGPEATSWINDSAKKLEEDERVGKAFTDMIKWGIEKSWEGLKTWVLAKMYDFLVGEMERQLKDLLKNNGVPMPGSDSSSSGGSGGGGAGGSTGNSAGANAVSNVVSSITNSVLGKASGGRVYAGTLYRINEHRADMVELFAPATNGSVIPLGGQQQAQGSGENININITLHGSSKEYAQQVAEIVVDNIKKARRYQ